MEINNNLICDEWKNKQEVLANEFQNRFFLEEYGLPLQDYFDKYPEFTSKLNIEDLKKYDLANESDFDAEVVEEIEKKMIPKRTYQYLIDNTHLTMRKFTRASASSKFNEGELAVIGDYFAIDEESLTLLANDFDEAENPYKKTKYDAEITWMQQYNGDTKENPITIN